MNKLFKRFTAMVLAVACVGAIGATAAAEDVCKPPVNWMALYIKGAPSSVNREYTYKMRTYGGGYDITCTELVGDYDRKITAWKQYNMRISGEIKTIRANIDDIYAETRNPIVVSNPLYVLDNYITFVFYASSPKTYETCRAYGVITHHQE